MGVQAAAPGRRVSTDERSFDPSNPPATIKACTQVKNTITDGGSTAMHSKAISGWTDGLEASPPRAPCGAKKKQ